MLKAWVPSIFYWCVHVLFKEVRQKVERKEDILLLADETQVERGQRPLLLRHSYVTFSPTLTPLLYIGYLPQLKLCTSACITYAPWGG